MPTMFKYATIAAISAFIGTLVQEALVSRVDSAKE